jgi:4-carboxymuconolactone decarboxylase
MAISETAQRNHDELFPGHVSTLKVTDPELIEVFDNFAFDEVLQHSGPDARTGSWCNWRPSRRAGAQRVPGYARRPLTAGVTPVALRAGARQKTLSWWQASAA